MADLSKLFVTIGAKTQGFEQGMKKVQTSSQTTMDKIKQHHVAIGAAATAMGGAIMYGANQAVAAFAIQEDAERQLAAALESTAGAAGLTFDELTKMASGFQEATTYGDELIIGAQSMMLTFTKVGKEVFPDAMQATLDMSTAMGTDLKSSVVMIGKALNDPIAGITAMTRAGVQFTEEQKKMIAGMVESGDIMGAQTMILEELNTQFGGSAAAAAETYSGQVDQMNNTFGDLQETIGGALMPVLIPMVETLSKIVSTMLDWANKVPFLTSVITIVVVALGGLLLVLGPLLMVMPGIAAVVTMTGLSFGGLAAGIGAAVVAAAPFLLVGAAIAALAYLIYDNWDDIVVFFEYVFSNMWEIVQKYWEWILLIIFPAGGIVALFIEHWEPIKAFFEGLWESVKDIFTDAWDTLYDVFVTSRIDAAKSAWNAIMEYFTGLWNNVANVFQSAWDAIIITVTEPYDIMVDVWQPIAGFFAGLWDDIQSTFDTVWRAIEGTVESVASIFESAWDSSIGWVISLFEDLWDTANDVLDAIMDKINAVIDGIRDAASWLDNATGNIGSSIWGAVSGRAEGGPVAGGSPYIVGEKGPELFVPNTSGNVIPNNALGGGNNMTINMNGITIREEADIDKIARALRREWEQTAMLGA